MNKTITKNIVSKRLYVECKKPKKSSKKTVNNYARQIRQHSTKCKKQHSTIKRTTHFVITERKKNIKAHEKKPKPNNYAFNRDTHNNKTTDTNNFGHRQENEL